MGVTLWTGMIQLRMQSSGRLSWTRTWAFGFQERRGSVWTTKLL